MGAFGLIGKTLKHSYSKTIHELLGGYAYELHELEAEELPAFVKREYLAGYNVTIPYKRAIMPLLDEVDAKALAIGAVNTVVHRDGRRIGYNTDFDGMIYMLRRIALDLDGKVVMILGSGGTSNTAQAVAKHLNAKEIIVVSRSGAVDYTSCYDYQHTQVIINTTPVGMYPNVSDCPIDLERFSSLVGVADVIYNPRNTLLVSKAKKLGLKATSGLPMLVAQAKYARDLFLDISTPDDVIEPIISTLESATSNIILIGMPGSGKSSVGKIVADVLHRPFVDIDTKIVEATGMTIPDIFAKHGEAYFRQVEKALTLDYAKESGLIISTGGGIVKDSDNYDVLHYNGVVIEISRPLHLLATDGRPLSKDGAVSALYQERAPLYTAFRDGIVYNDSDIDTAAKGVIKQYENTCNQRR